MKKVLLASDGSTFAEEAAWFLAHLPHEERLELIVLSVLVAPHAYRATLRRDWVDMCLEQDRLRGVEAFAKVQEIFEGANVSLEHQILEGHAGETIVDVAASERCDLVVLGARGHSAVSRILLGSTSDYVATHAPCSVVVVRPTGIREPQHGLRIMVGYEETDAAQAAIDEIGGICWGPEVGFHLVTVCYLPEVYAGSLIDDAKAAVTRAANQIRKIAPKTETHLIENDHLGEGLVMYAEDHRCDLLVVGETPRGTIGRVFMGSTSRFVLRHAPCSVWIARNRITRNLTADQSVHSSQHSNLELTNE